jgi:hypothetical protein
MGNGRVNEAPDIYNFPEDIKQVCKLKMSF